MKQDQTKKEEWIQNLEALNNGLQKENQELQKQLLKDQQRLQGKANSKKLETEYNQLKQEKAKLENQRQQDAKQYPIEHGYVACNTIHNSHKSS